MSSSFGSIPSQLPHSTAELRRLLEQALPSDAALEAFCLDYLPDVHRQLSGGMERTRKLNLILASAPPEELVEHLHRHAAAHKEGELTSSERSSANTAGSQREARLVASRSRMVIGVLCGAIAVAGLVLWLRSSRENLATAGAAGTEHGTAAPAQLHSGAPDPATWLTSDPPSALIYAVPSGLLLGQTPWTPDSATPWDVAHKKSLQVCLRSPGFVPMLVKLEPGAEPSRPRPIHVRLQRETRAASQRDLGQESCNVPTPLLE